MLKRHCTNAFGHGDVMLSGVDQQLPASLDVFRAHIEPARDLWRSRALDLNGPDVAPRQAKGLVKFSSGRSAIEEGFGAGWCSGKKGLDT